MTVLLVSGGHTQVIDARGYKDFSLIAQTMDDSFGESFDKVAKMLGLGYPGGPIVEAYAKKGDEKRFDFTVPLANSGKIAFSYSGLKNQVRLQIAALGEEISDQDRSLIAVYKPGRGESPLWDFDHGTLCNRETAAYQVSLALNWDLVPPTILRQGPYGRGSVQFYVENDPDQHYFSVRDDARFAAALRRIVLFDYIINNADRKSGHCLVSADGRMWAIDHGVCFHVEYKLRSVIWEFSGQPIALDLLADMARFDAVLADRYATVSRIFTMLLTGEEVEAMRRRLAHLLNNRSYPAPAAMRRNYPWPPI